MSQYGQLSVHRWMLRDSVRNEAYRRALAHVVKPGDTVLDLGAGTGILSVFAAAAGAKKVIGVEPTDTALLARRIVEANGFSDRIEILQASVEDITLTEKVDVLVSEWMGGFGVDENILAPLVMTRDRHLKPGGTIVPGRVTAFLAPAEIPEFDAQIAHWRGRLHGIDLSLIARMTTQETFHTQIHLETSNLVAEPQVMWSHDPYTTSLAVADSPFVSKLSFTAARAGMLSGFVAWFTAEMGDGNTLTNAVGATDTHWGRTLFPVDRPIELVAGTPVQVELHCDPSLAGSCEFSWVVQVGDRAPERHDTRPSRRPQ